MSLFEQQDAAEQDYLDGPGFTGSQVHPSTFEGLTPMTPVMGAAAGAEEGIGILAGGLPSLAHTYLTGLQLPGGFAEAAAARLTGKDPLADVAETRTKALEKPWAAPVAEAADTFDMAARKQAKKLMPDPSVTGTGTNLIFGFAKSAAQAAGAMVSRDPLLAAPIFGYLQGLGSYRDLRDQGVDEKTAQRLATLQGVTAGASFLAPAGLPTRWLSEMGPAAQAVTQLATGASINIAAGMGSRYLTSKVLADAGYPELAEQSKVLDGQAMLADMLSGAFFGGVHFFSGRAQAMADAATKAAESGALDPSVRDAAKVSQDAHEAAISRAPGIPLDGETAGAHRMALEKALNDVLSDRPVDVGDIFSEHDARFVRVPRDDGLTQSARELVHQEFMDAGVMAESSKVDQLEGRLESLYQGKPVTPYEEPVRIPTEDGSVAEANEALARLKEQQGRDESQRLFDLAAECGRRTA